MKFPENTRQAVYDWVRAMGMDADTEAAFEELKNVVKDGRIYNLQDEHLTEEGDLIVAMTAAGTIHPVILFGESAEHPDPALRLGFLNFAQRSRSFMWFDDVKYMTKDQESSVRERAMEVESYLGEKALIYPNDWSELDLSKDAIIDVLSDLRYPDKVREKAAKHVRGKQLPELLGYVRDNLVSPFIWGRLISALAGVLASFKPIAPESMAAIRERFELDWTPRTTETVGKLLVDLGGSQRDYLREMLRRDFYGYGKWIIAKLLNKYGKQ